MTTLQKRASETEVLRHARITDVSVRATLDDQYHWTFDIETPKGEHYCVWVNADVDGKTTGFLRVTPDRKLGPQ